MIHDHDTYFTNGSSIHYHFITFSLTALRHDVGIALTRAVNTYLHIQDSSYGEYPHSGSWTFMIPFLLKLSGQWKVSPWYKQRSNDLVDLKTWCDYAERKKGPFLLGHVQVLSQAIESVPGLPKAILDVLPKAEFEHIMKNTLKDSGQPDFFYRSTEIKITIQEICLRINIRISITF